MTITTDGLRGKTFAETRIWFLFSNDHLFTHVYQRNERGKGRRRRNSTGYNTYCAWMAGSWIEHCSSLVQCHLTRMFTFQSLRVYNNKNNMIWVIYIILYLWYDTRISVKHTTYTRVYGGGGGGRWKWASERARRPGVTCARALSVVAVSECVRVRECVRERERVSTWTRLCGNRHRPRHSTSLYSSGV